MMGAETVQYLEFVYAPHDRVVSIDNSFWGQISPYGVYRVHPKRGS